MTTALPVQLRHGHRDRGEVGVIDQQEEGLGGVELQPAPDDLDELPHGHVVRDQELGLVQHRQLLLAPEPLDDAGHLGRVLRPDLLHILYPQSCNDSVTCNNSLSWRAEEVSQAGCRARPGKNPERNFPGCLSWPESR